MAARRRAGPTGKFDYRIFVRFDIGMFTVIAATTRFLRPPTYVSRTLCFPGPARAAAPHSGVTRGKVGRGVTPWKMSPSRDDT